MYNTLLYHIFLRLKRVFVKVFYFISVNCLKRRLGRSARFFVDGALRYEVKNE